MSLTQSFSTAPTAPSRFNLPQELIDMVIDHLDDGDDGGLREVGLVSRQWYFHTRERLFHFVELQPRDTVLHFVGHIGRLQEMVTANPPLAHCVKILSVGDLSPSWFGNDFKDFGNVFADLLARLTNVSRLSIAGAVHEAALVHWGSIPVQVRKTIYTHASTPTLHRLRFEAMDGIDLRLFIQNANLEVLELRGCRPCTASLPLGSGPPTSIPPDEPWAPPSTCQPEGSEVHTLRSLTIDNSGGMFCDFIRYQREQKPPPSWLRTRQLIVGAVPWDDAMDEALKKVLENSATLVEKYIVEQGYDEDLDDDSNSPLHPSLLAFHRFPNLTLLKIITLGNELSRWPALNPLPAITSALDRISQPGDESKLEEFEIEFDFGPAEENDDLDASNEHSPLAHFHETIGDLQVCFSELDKTLCRSAFRRLKSVTFTFDFSGCPITPEADLGFRLVFARMKRVNKRGMLKLRTVKN